MTRKEILLFQLREIRNELADALTGLDQAALTAQPAAGHNTIGWLVCHCLANWDYFLHQPQTDRSLLAGGRHGALAAYTRLEPARQAEAPDFRDLAAAADEVLGTCVDLIERLDEEALDRPAPFWRRQHYESVAGNCVRVVNHGNAHLREIWLLRGLLDLVEPWPSQTLLSTGDAERSRFYVPDRATVLARRTIAGR